MPKLSFGFAILAAEFRFLAKRGEDEEDEYGNKFWDLPWGYAEAEEKWKFPEGHHPSKGLRSLTRDHPDVELVIKNDSDWTAWQEFMKRMAQTTNEAPSTIFDQVCNTRAVTPYAKGASLFNQFWRKVWTRSKLGVAVDNVLKERRLLPHHQYSSNRTAWPPKVSVSFLLHHSPC